MNRKEVIACVNAFLEHKIQEITSELTLLQNDLSNETKSSAGDKFETAREMIEQERKKFYDRLAELNKQHQLLQGISVDFSSKTIASGSIFSHKETIYFIGVAIGNIPTKNQFNLISVGMLAPFTQAILGKKEGESVLVNGNEIRIEKIFS